jgi:hypothetical protein
VQTSRIAAIVGVVVALAVAFYWASPRDESRSAPAAAQSAPEKPNGPVAFAVLPTIEDRFISEPCSRIPGGGLFSLQAAMADVALSAPGAIGVSFGDLTLAAGGIGRHVANYHYSEVLSKSGVSFVAAGEGELGLGVGFLREALTRLEGVKFLCANAVDEKGQRIMGGWQLAKSAGRGVMIVAVAADSMQAELARRGSDVRLTPAQKAVDDARAEALAQAARAGLDVSVFALFVHGTEDEAASIVEKTPGVTFAAAAHGPILPTSEPRTVGGVPILYAGRGMRFGWAMFVPPNSGPLDPAMLRVGGRLLAKDGPGEALRFFREVARVKMYEDVESTPGERAHDPRGAYVGASRCGDCHIEIAAQFAPSAHAKPSAAILASPFVGSTSCAGCHQTGAYWTGGWKGPADTKSDLAAVSCEACHGPGEVHCATPKTGRMSKVGMSRCYDCHLPDRAPDFDAEAAWKRSGHKFTR